MPKPQVAPTEESGLTALIAAAESAMAAAVVAAEKERDARVAATGASNQAREAWNAVFDELARLKNEHSSQQAFRESKLGQLLGKM